MSEQATQRHEELNWRYASNVYEFDVTSHILNWRHAQRFDYISEIIIPAQIRSRHCRIYLVLE